MPDPITPPPAPPFDAAAAAAAVPAVLGPPLPGQQPNLHGMPANITINTGAPAAPAAAPMAPPAPIAPALPPGVTLTMEQFNAFQESQNQLTRLQIEKTAADRAAQEKHTALLIEKGQIEEALRLTRSTSETELAAARTLATETDSRARRYALDGELARSLASLPLVHGAAEQLTFLWRGHLEAHPEGNSYTVRTPTFQSVGTFIAEQLVKPEYAHFLRPQGNPAGGSAGGATSAAGAGPTAPPVAAAPPVPANMGEAIILHMQSLAKPQTTDPATDLSRSFGLKRQG